MRPLYASDSRRIEQLAGDDRVAATTLSIPHPYPDGLAEEWISMHESEFIEQKLIVLAICSQATNEIIGAVSLTIKMDFQLAELGYWIGVAYWNQGYCTEACFEMLRYGFEVLNLNKICANHFAGNPSSGKVLQKLGMQKEAYLRKHLKSRNVFHDIIGYGILKEEFLSNRKF